MNRRFRTPDGPRLTQEEALRQSRVTSLALTEFVQPALAIAFLNEPDDALGGSPLQVAVRSAEGLLAVERSISGRNPS